MRVVHKPNIPQKGMNTLKKFVTRNIRLVLILKYFWIYQNPKVEMVEVTAWTIPRYVSWRNEKDTLLFWIMLTSVPVT